MTGSRRSNPFDAKGKRPVDTGEKVDRMRISARRLTHKNARRNSQCTLPWRWRSEPWSDDAPGLSTAGATIGWHFEREVSSRGGRGAGSGREKPESRIVGRHRSKGDVNPPGSSPWTDWKQESGPIVRMDSWMHQGERNCAGRRVDGDVNSALRRSLSS